MHVDFGTGDGALVRRAAVADAATLVIGVDASADGLREVSRRAARRPKKGGLPNARFGRLSLDEAPGALAGVADRVTVVLPWGYSLLGAVAVPRADGLARLAAICRPGAELRVVFGYGPADARAVRELGLPSLEAPDALAALEAGYLEAGLSARPRRLPLEELKSIPST